MATSRLKHAGAEYDDADTEMLIRADQLREPGVLKDAHAPAENGELLDLTRTVRLFPRKGSKGNRPYFASKNADESNVCFVDVGERDTAHTLHIAALRSTLSGKNGFGSDRMGRM